MSLRAIRALVWSISESHICDTLTKEAFKFISLSEIKNSPLAPLIKKWKLLPHLISEVRKKIVRISVEVRRLTRLMSGAASFYYQSFYFQGKCLCHSFSDANTSQKIGRQKI
jgi:hypothetical protein